jgi:hypothetical protein
MKPISDTIEYSSIRKKQAIVDVLSDYIFTYIHFQKVEVNTAIEIVAYKIVRKKNL